MLRPMHMVRGLVVLCVLALAGCAEASERAADRPATANPAVASSRATPASSQAARAAFLPDPGVNYEALASGVLRGDDVSGCLWLEVAGGEARVARQTPLLVYDDEAYVDFTVEPAEVRTEEGRLLVRLGDWVELGGGHRPVKWMQAVPGCPVTSSHVFVSSRFPR